MEMRPPPMATEEQAVDQVRRSAHLEKREVSEFDKAATTGMGNRAERRRRQALLKKMMRRR